MPAHVRPRISAFAGMAAASFAANLWGGVPPLSCLAYTLANMCEAAVALWLIRRRPTDELSFMVPRSVARFCVAALGASMASAVLAGTLVGAGADFYMSWLTTVLLGMLIVTTPIVVLARMVGTNALGNTPPSSEERRVGKGGVSPCRSRWSPVH